MAVAEGYWTPEFLQRVRNVDRLAHALRLDLVRAALQTSSEAGAVSIESAADVVSDKIKKASV